jgi:N-acetyl-gamma-glutamyl-phosphate reductase
MKARVGIVGATGYTGEELLLLIARHPNIELAFATSEKEQGQKLCSYFPRFSLPSDMIFISADQALDHPVELVFLCLPAGESARLGKSFFSQGCKIIDLGADFRFADAQEYDRWYHQPHKAPELLSQAVYGLPEWYRKEVQGAKIVGNPGCYPTSALLALLPFSQQDLIAEQPIIIDSKSGLSGAGKTLSRASHFMEANENVVAYKAGRAHRHVGEMETILQRDAFSPGHILFTPQLVPMARGIFSCVYFTAKNAIADRDAMQILRDAYESEAFVHVLDDIPSTRLAQNSNHCFLHVLSFPETNQIVVFSAIDNLGKGASWQAVQNMNIMMNWPETTALI